MVIHAISMKAILFGTLATTSLCVGLAGVVLPGLPSTEFILLAVWAADRSSPRMHSWLLSQPYVGAIMLNWQKGKMPRRAKYAATLTMSLSAMLIFQLIKHTPSAIMVVSIMAAVLIWLWRRPE
jgi:uncharacterized protein